MAAKLITKLQKIVGEKYLQHVGEQLHVSPATTDEVSAILRAANDAGAVVMPTGGGTKLGWGNPVAAQVVLHTSRMKKVLEHTWQDLTVCMQAGCTWDGMQQTLARHGQMVALDPMWPELATIGGIAATNDSGALRLRYGSLRDLVLGMTIVLADGTIARSGGKVVKNVAGYDMHKLMTGAHGTLGIITEVNFRLHPLEKHAEQWSVLGDVAALGSAMLKVLDSTMQVSAMQIVSSGMGQPARLDVRFAGHPDCLADQRERLRAIVGGLEMEINGDTVWKSREKLFSRAAQRDALVIKAVMLPTQIASITAMLGSGNCESQSVTQARGLMTAALYGNAETLARLVRELRSELAYSGGSVVVLRMPQAMQGSIDAWGEVGTSLPLMRRVKYELDSASILNRGRMAGGI